MIEQLKDNIYIVIGIATIFSFIGQWYTHKFKTKRNCENIIKANKRIDGMEITIHEIKEKDIPYFVRKNELTSHCNSNQSACEKRAEQRDSLLLGTITKLETTILNRLDKMDKERAASIEKQTEQRVKSTEQFTKLETTVNNLVKKLNNS